MTEWLLSHAQGPPRLTPTRHRRSVDGEYNVLTVDPADAPIIIDKKFVPPVSSRLFSQSLLYQHCMGEMFKPSWKL